MYKNNHVLGGVAWEVAHLCEFRGNFGGGAASKKGGEKKSEQDQGWKASTGNPTQSSHNCIPPSRLF